MGMFSRNLLSFSFVVCWHKSLQVHQVDKNKNLMKRREKKILFSTLITKLSWKRHSAVQRGDVDVLRRHFKDWSSRSPVPVLEKRFFFLAAK